MRKHQSLLLTLLLCFCLGLFCACAPQTDPTNTEQNTQINGTSSSTDSQTEITSSETDSTTDVSTNSSTDKSTDSSVTDTENNNTSTDQTPPAKYVGCAAGPALPPLKEPPQEVVPPGTFPDPATLPRANTSDVGTTQTLPWATEHTTGFLYLHDPVSGKERLIVAGYGVHEGGTCLFTIYELDVNGTAGLYESIKNGSITLTVRNRILISNQDLAGLYDYSIAQGGAADGSDMKEAYVLWGILEDGKIHSVLCQLNGIEADQRWGKEYALVKRTIDRYSIKVEW